MTIKVLFNSLKNQVYHERIKHIDMKLHFIIDEVEKRSVVVKKAKVIPIAKFKLYMNLISFLEVALVDKLCARRFFFMQLLWSIIKLNAIKGKFLDLSAYRLQLKGQFANMFLT